MRHLALLVILAPVLYCPAAAAQEPPPAAPATEAPPPPPPAPASGGNEPLAGFSDGTAFLRSTDGQFVLLPSGRVHIDGYAFVSDDKPNPGFLLRRARAELSGWIGPMV